MFDQGFLYLLWEFLLLLDYIFLSLSLFTCFQKYGEREHISSLDTEPPVTEFEQQTTRNTRLKEYMTTPHIHHRIKKTTQTTESRLIRLVALETTETLKTKKSRQTRPTTTELSLPVQVNYTNITTSITTATTTTATSTESSLKQHVMFTSPAASTQKPLTQSEEYDTTASSVAGPLTQLTEQTTTMSTVPVTSLQKEQPLTTTAGKISIQVEESTDGKAAHITTTSAQHINHTTPRVGKSEQQLTTTDNPVHWHLTKKSSVSTTGLSDTQHLEYTTKPSPLQSQPETISSIKNPLLTYKTTNLINSTESTKATFIAESLKPEDQLTQHMLVYGKQASTQSTDLLTSSTLDAENESSVTPTIASEKDYISNHTKQEITSSSKSSESPFNSLTTPPTTLNNSSSATLSTAPVGELSSLTPANENVTSHSITAAVGFTITDRSTKPSISTTDSTDKESATPTSLLTSTNSSGPHSQPIYLLIGTSGSTDSTIPTITSTADSTIITDSSISVIDDLLLQTTPTVKLINISSISTTTDEPINTAITEETSAVISKKTASGSFLSVMSTQHSPLTSDKTSTTTPSHRNQKMILNATVVTG